MQTKLLSLAVFVVGLDQVTKALVAENLRVGESVSLIGDVLRITHVRNPGAAFGLLRGFGGVIALVALVGVVVFVAFMVKQPSAGMGVGAAMVAAGASGNLIDRFTRGPVGRGTVVDFVDFKFWPSFNVADSSIFIGALILIWFSLSEDRSGDTRAATDH